MAKGSRISVAELAGKFSCQAPLAKEDEANKPVRRRPPRTLPIPASNDVSQGKDEQKADAGSHPPRKNRNSALIEKLQASLSPTALMPSPLSPGAGKPQLPFFPPHSPSSPVSPTSASKPSQPETPASFEAPAEGSVLQNINKGRARHSIKRRPPSRRHRKSSAEEGGTEEEKATSPISGQTTPDGVENDVFDKEKAEKEEIHSTVSASAPSKQQQHQTSADSEQQPITSTGGEEDGKECAVSPVKEEMVDKEKKPEQPELDSSNEETKNQEPEEEGKNQEPEEEGKNQEPEEEGKKEDPEGEDKKQEPEEEGKKQEHDNEAAQEVQSEPATVVEGIVVQEVKKEEESEGI